MLKFYDKFTDQMLLRTIQGTEVGQIDGIVLFDLRKSGGSFRLTIETTLRILRQYDPRRYARVVRYISRIVNQITTRGRALYIFNIRTVQLEFSEWPNVSDDLNAASYACLLVNESTRGVISSKGIEYSAKNRVRIERLCAAEQNRFAAKVVAADPLRYPSKILIVPFDEKSLDEARNTDFLVGLWSILWRTITDWKLNQKVESHNRKN